MPLNYQDLRYRSDAHDEKELYETYQIENHLDNIESSQKDGYGHREKLIKNGIKLTNQVSPRIYKIFQEVCSKLDIDTTYEIYCLPTMDINAFAILDIRESGIYSMIGITSGALENLDDKEIKYVIGHELGHFLFGNNRLNLLFNDKESQSRTVLPLLGESLFLDWIKKAEISADRIGLIACGDFNVSARALIKVAYGLSEKNLNLDIDSLINQINEIKGHPELMNEKFSSHPLLPIRLKAIELFSQSNKAARNGFQVKYNQISDEELEESIDKLMLLTRRYPYKPLYEAVMKMVALGGTLTILADGKINNEEIKKLIEILHFFTDEPEKEIITDIKNIQELLPQLAEKINNEGDYNEKLHILLCLVDVATVDGALQISEGKVIMQIAANLNITVRQAHDIITEAAKSFGIKADPKLSKIADELKRNLQLGYKK